MDFLWIVGPPAVGKMAVGLEITKKIGYKLLHNHGTIELLIPIFEYGSPMFNILNDEFHRRIFEEVVRSNLSGFIFTYVSSFDLEEEKEYMENINTIFKSQGHTVYFVELYPPLKIQLERIKHPIRLNIKPSKRDIDLSDERIARMDEKYKMNSTEMYPFFFQENYIKIDNSNLSSEKTANLVISAFSFPTND